MPRKKIETIINEKIAPFSLSETGKSKVTKLVTQYPYELLRECIDIGISSYFQFDDTGRPTQDSINTFVNKLGGIAYNKSLSPIEQEISHQKNKCKKRYTYWNDSRADEILQDYVSALRNAGWDDDQILHDLQTEVSRLSSRAYNWTQWSDVMMAWIADTKHWNDEDVVSIQEAGTILPTVLFDNLPTNIKNLCKQINASYEHNLFDCTAVMMRRLLEGLLVLTYQNNGIEAEILGKGGTYHITLDKIIKDAEKNATLSLSGNTKKELALFKDLGNYSAHKIWYSCTQQDIEPRLLKYRVIVEELMHKAGIK